MRLHKLQARPALTSVGNEAVLFLHHDALTGLLCYSIAHETNSFFVAASGLGVCSRATLVREQTAD